MKIVTEDAAQAAGIHISKLPDVTKPPETVKTGRLIPRARTTSSVGG